MSGQRNTALEALAREWARIAEPTGADYADMAQRAAAAGCSFPDVQTRASEIQAETPGFAPDAREGEVLLTDNRATVFAAAARALARRKRVFAQGKGDARRLVLVQTLDDLHNVDPEAEERLERRVDPLLHREPMRDEEDRPMHAEDGTPLFMPPVRYTADQLVSVNDIILAMEINIAADVKKRVTVQRNGRAVVEWVSCDFPQRMAKALMDSTELRILPQLRGVAHVPIMAADGSVVTTPGYHAESEMWITSTLPRVTLPDRPTRDDALASLDKLRHLFREYEFADPANQTAGVAALMTAVTRPSVDKAPLTLSTSGAPRTGKDHLMRSCSLVAIGQMPDIMSLGTRGEERDKRLSQIFHSGSPAVILSNINGGLESDDLCVFISEGGVTVRTYGTFGVGKRAEYSAFWSATGNNLQPKGDLVTRCMTVRQVSASATPGRRTFTFDIHTWLQDPANRASIIEAVLTIVRWWRQSGRWLNTGQLEGGSLGGTNDFNQWAAMVRAPLYALTEHDVFAATFDSEDTQRSEDGAGAFCDACGIVFDAAWRVDYPWSQRDAQRRVDQWRQHNPDQLVAPEPVQRAEALTAEHVGELSDDELCRRVEAMTPSEYVELAGGIVRAADKVRRFTRTLREDEEHGSAPSEQQAAWLTEVEGALSRLGKAANDERTAGHQVKAALDVAGGAWRMGIALQPSGRPMRGGANGARQMYRWKRL